MIHFEVMIRSRRAPGHPVEMFFWRLCERTPNGMRRELVYNATAGSDLPTVLWSLGVGRFRVEWRDRRRLVVRVEAWAVYPDGVCERVPPMVRRRLRSVPPPQHVARGTPQEAVRFAPVVDHPRPALRAREERPRRHPR
jgi:hypothetical protein